MKNIWKKCRKAFPFLLLAAVILTVAFYPVPQESQGETAKIVSVWNVDTFEGGKGSRTSFLKRVARLAEKSSGETYYRVISYTAEGARAAMLNGEYPDILSFGVGLEVEAARCVSLGRTFAGNSLAVPWCRGKYYLFSLTDDFDENGETAVSVGGNNLSCAAAYFSGIEGTERESLAAYLSFLNGEFRYLLGTQRDSNRFNSRGVTVYSRELSAYCDLYQYVCILSEDMKKECRLFLDVLFSDDIQSSLTDIGMFPAEGASGRTVDVFSTRETLGQAAEAVRSGSSEKNAEKYFKSV